MAFIFETPMASSRPVSLDPTSPYESSIQHVPAGQRPPRLRAPASPVADEGPMTSIYTTRPVVHCSPDNEEK